MATKNKKLTKLENITDEELKSLEEDYLKDSEEFDVHVTINKNPDQYVMARIRFIGPYKASLYNPKDNVEEEYKRAFLDAISKEDYDKIQQIIHSGKVYNVSANVKFYIKMPMTTLKEREFILAAKGIRRPIARRDCDNMAKLLFDSLHDVCYTDDCFIVEETISKYNALEPRIEISLHYKTFNEELKTK